MASKPDKDEERKERQPEPLKGPPGGPPPPPPPR